MSDQNDRPNQDALIPLSADGVQNLAEITGRPLTKAVRIGESGSRNHNRAYGHTDAPINSGGLYLIDLDSGEVLEEITNPPWLCPRCEEVHPRVDPCTSGKGPGESRSGRNQYRGFS